MGALTSPSAGRWSNRGRCRVRLTESCRRTASHLGPRCARRCRDGRRQDRHYLGERYRRIRRRRGKQKAIVATARAILKIAYPFITNRDLRYHDLGPSYHDQLGPQRQTRNKIRDPERLSPGMKVTLTATAA